MAGRLPAWAMPVILIAGAGAVFALGRVPGRRFVIYPEGEVSGVRDVHEFRGQPLCQGCHVGGSRQLQAEPVALCLRCHVAEHNSHPVKVEQRAPMMRSLPLAPGNRVGCHSCHDPHVAQRPGHGLRLPFNDLCTSCHAGH